MHHHPARSRSGWTKVDSVLQYPTTDTLRIGQVPHLHPVQRGHHTRSGVTIEPADPTTEWAAASVIDELLNFDHRHMVTDVLPGCIPVVLVRPYRHGPESSLSNRLFRDINRTISF